MECHGLEMKGPIRSGDGIDAIEIESGTGKVSIKEGFRFFVGSNLTYKTLACDTQLNASWQTRSVPVNTKMLFLQASVPVGWVTETSFVDGAMLVYKRWTGTLSSKSDGGDPKSWTPNATFVGSDGLHYHKMEGVTGPGDVASYGASDDKNIAINTHTHTYTGYTTWVGSEHTHGVSSGTWEPKYQEVIMGKKS